MTTLPVPRVRQTAEKSGLLRPRSVALQLGIAPTTLRLWSNQYAAFLSTSARKENGEDGSAHRRYTSGDVQVLARAKALIDSGLTHEEARQRLGQESTELAVPVPEIGDIEFVKKLERLQEQLSQLPRQQHRLAQAVLKTPELIMFGSVRELAQSLHVNNATIIRFAQSLGYSGYQALQAAMRQAYLPLAGLQAPRDSAARNNPTSVVAATLAQHNANLTLSAQSLQTTDLDQIGDLLINARRILVCASGTAGVPALLLVRLLRHVGLRGELVPPAGMDRAIAFYDAGAADVIVGIGLWLTFKGLVEALTLGRRLGARTIAITGSPTSPLTDVADHVLIAPAQGAALSFSTVATVAVVEALIAHIAGQRPQQTAEIEQALHDLYLQEDLLAPLLNADQQ
jgi:DNA-binding MurR/RpiR family transcriptional regulator